MGGGGGPEGRVVGGGGLRFGRGSRVVVRGLEVCKVLLEEPLLFFTAASHRSTTTTTTTTTNTTNTTTTTTTTTTPANVLLLREWGSVPFSAFHLLPNCLLDLLAPLTSLGNKLEAGAVKLRPDHLLLGGRGQHHRCRPQP